MGNDEQQILTSSSEHYTKAPPPPNVQQPCADAQISGTTSLHPDPSSRTDQEALKHATLEKSKQAKKNAARRRKERRIKQLLTLEDIFEENKHQLYYVITFPGVDIDSELNILTADKELKSAIGIPNKTSKLNKNSLLVQVKSENQAKKLLNLKRIDDKIITVELHKTMNFCKGTILSEALSQNSEEEILEAVKDQGVVKVERMKRKVDGVLTNTNRYIITFQRTKLPSLLKLAEWHREIVYLYIPNPMSCRRCQRYGHTQKWCRRTTDTCARCAAEGHVSPGCSAPIKCANCGSQHYSTNKECDQYKFRSEILATQARMHITYGEAADAVRERYREEGKTYRYVTARRTVNEPTINETPENRNTNDNTIAPQNELNVSSDINMQDEPENSQRTTPHSETNLSSNITSQSKENEEKSNSLPSTSASAPKANSKNTNRGKKNTPHPPTNTNMDAPLSIPKKNSTKPSPSPQRRRHGKDDTLNSSTDSMDISGSPIISRKRQSSGSGGVTKKLSYQHEPQKEQRNTNENNTYQQIPVVGSGGTKPPPAPHYWDDKNKNIKPL